MKEVLREFITSLHSLPLDSEGLRHELYELVESIEKVEGNTLIIPEIFNFMEIASKADLGTPGPLVHFIEKDYPKYIEHLVVSLKNKPTLLTLWMANRLLNIELEKKTYNTLISILEVLMNSDSFSKDLREEAKNYYERHSKTSS